MSNTPFSNPVIRWIGYRLPIFTFLHHEQPVLQTKDIAASGGFR
jgi:hypothetical protein